MIARLTGSAERGVPGEVVLDVGGVGYLVHVPLGTYAGLPPPDRPCTLRVVTVVREDEISLFGFATAAEEELFHLLVAVNGVGPRLALKILSGINPPQLRKALITGDMGVLTGISGVGKKLAQRLVMELKDKIGLEGEAGLVWTDLAEAGDAATEALRALEALGYPTRTAQAGLRAAREAGAVAVEELVKEALRALAPKR